MSLTDYRLCACPSLDRYAAALDPAPGWFRHAMGDVTRSMAGMQWNHCPAYTVDPGNIPWWGAGNRTIKSIISFPEDGTRAQICHLALHEAELELQLREQDRAQGALGRSQDTLRRFLLQRYGSNAEQLIAAQNSRDTRAHGPWFSLAALSVELRLDLAPGTVLDVGHGWEEPQELFEQTYCRVMHIYDPAVDLPQQRQTGGKYR